MLMTDRPTFLRTVLRFDAATCVATGLLMSAGSGFLAGLTQIPSGVLLSAGLSLFPIAAFIAFVAAREPVWPIGVWLVIVGNIGWVLASIWLVGGGAINANVLGITFVLMQAGAVALLAVLEYVGLGREAAAA